MRPIGICTLDDRTVQEAIRMLIEPIYDSTFLNCSQGFRPNRRTMDAIQVCYQRINPSTKYYWVIEGDIKSCFDRIDRKILLKLLRKRIADRKLVGFINKFLKAGYQENGITHKPECGICQGGVLSPLSANVYLHELDKWWSVNYAPDQKTKNARRRAGLGNFILVRFADDLIILSNGTKQATEAMRAEVAEFLWDELKLELSQEKTAVTHATEGFDFLGFHIRKYRSRNGVIIKPTKSNVQSVKDKIARLLDRRNYEYSVVNMIYALSPVVRGWANYYRFVNSYHTFDSLDLYLCRKFLKWYRGKYRLPLRKGTREGLKWIDKKQPIHLFQFTEVKVKRYRWERKSNPYLEMRVKRMTDNPLPQIRWYGNANRDADLRIQCFQRDQGVCQICRGCKTNLHAHHIIPLSEGGEDVLDNLITLCEDCHRKHSWQEIRRLAGSRMRCKVACPVST